MQRYDIGLDWEEEISPRGEMIFDADGVRTYLEGGTEHRYYYTPRSPHPVLFAHSWQEGLTIFLRFKSGIFRSEYWSYIGIEHILLGHGAFVLHSASVLRGSAILFSAPSGTGKSTQADLWKKYRGVIGINGDRNLLWKIGDDWFVAGFPWHGTSTDCENVLAPLLAIAVPRQAKADAVRSLSGREKTMALLSEATYNRWNKGDAAAILDLVEDLASCVEVVGLDCTMNETAVEALEEYL